MEEIISKEEFEEFIKIKGEVRGLGLQTEAKFISEKKGKEALKKLEDEMARLGHPYSDIKTMEFYPLGLIALALLTIKRLFDFTDKDFQELGAFEAKASLIVRLFMKYFISLDGMVKEVPKMWRKYYSVGDFKVMDLKKEEKEVVLRIENFKVHPILCQVFIGYFSSLMRMITKSDHITCQETKCVHKGDEYHEFFMKW